MASSSSSILALLVLLTFVNFSVGTRPRNLGLWVPDVPVVTLHGGGVLQGNIPVNIVWYGGFTWPQKSIIIDFITSLTSFPWQEGPSVLQWFSKIDEFYLSKVPNYNNQQTQITLGNQIDNSYVNGTYLSLSQIEELASCAGTPEGGITLVFTSDDVVVEGFCMSHCGIHGSDENTRSTFIWVGNSCTQCPGQCAWPFHQPLYGPQTPPLVAPNEVGIDGMVMILASLFAGTMTNPYGDGYFQGPQGAPLEACTACPGVYGRGAFPGYAGQLLLDDITGASYNANGANGRKFMMPAVMDPLMAYCFTLN